MTDAAADLADFLEDRLSEEGEGLSLVDDGQVVAAQRRLARAREELARVEQAARDEIELVNEWKERAAAPVERRVALLQGMLADFLRRKLDAQLQPLLEQGLPLEVAWDRMPSKSVTLPGGAGRLQARIRPAAPAISDEETFVAWASEHAPEFLRHTPALSDLKRSVAIKDDIVVTADGVVVPGVVVVPPRIDYGEPKPS